MIMSLATFYTHSRLQPMEPPSNAVRILNQVMTLPADEDVIYWQRIGCYFLREYFVDHLQISKGERGRVYCMANE